ncbi:URC4/urg3 family protein [Mycobacterium sp. CVI_P3]|uniref:URC4/urg3 family protein n=1 Tax=Mycobacterium pinniadriaticum TaxID=2994102 RepID=A0ABT3S7N9_9MYCO|nr:URC4/urg3 family protein [Mycobacterium pinniadriaticum]MCX2929091.1 URC4/urg3 family protein [Mycobacterium pinniadriaticum]MCX2935516.1 URC4/urg3 family protein [Mycobacterium pinniadriaticum]
MRSAVDVDVDTPAGAAAALRSTRAVRERARLLTERARAGESPWFTVHDDQLASAAALVAEVTRDSYPDLQIPFHSRWRHFEAGGVDRKAELDRLLTGVDVPARAMIDLTVVSVLLDAGAGPTWSYLEPDTGLRLNRSEGLGVASFHAFTAGVFSSDPDDPLRVDAAGLAGLTERRLAEAFQSDAANPLVGVDGRVAVLRRLGAALASAPEVFGTDGRPGGLLDAVPAPGCESVRAHDILTVILTSLASIWPGGNMIDDQAVGDCWRHRALDGPGLTAGWMPFHKLSQWLTYSLLEPFGWAGVAVTDLDDLTGLPEYRNGGLLLDTGVLRLHDPRLADRSFTAADELVVEWRALTVALLDELTPVVREQLGVDAETLPLARVLEGGTWAAGRRLAQRLREGLPPLAIVSDGTVF